MTRTKKASKPVAAVDTCEACEYAKEHGWWGPKRPARSHCRDCHRYWESKLEGHCARCCRHFSNTPAFDAHLTEEACTDPATLTRQDGRPRMVARTSPFGTTWALVNYRELPDFEALREQRDQKG